jgi:hypothetical protein
MVKEREYLISVNKLNEPVVEKDQRAIALLLLRLILLDPGSDPLHPDMGVGIRKFRFSVNTLNDLKDRVKKQIERYLPDFIASDVNIVINSNKTCNIEITIDDTIYTYDSNSAPVAISLEDISNS